MPKAEEKQDQLLPAKHANGDLFVCDVADAVLKDLIPQMEHPFYSLSKNPDTAIRKYEHNGNWLQIIPSVKGLATIYDKDILIYCISQLMQKMKHGEPVGPRLRITSYELLVFTNRGTAGKDYDALCEAIDRLAGTRIALWLALVLNTHFAPLPQLSRLLPPVPDVFLGLPSILTGSIMPRQRTPAQSKIAIGYLSEASLGSYR